MLVSRILAPAFLLGLFIVPASAASFDCSKAGTPFEHAICDFGDLSLADGVLAKTFATAIGGLSKDAEAAMRTDQRNWLSYVQRVCTDDAKPMTTRRYDEKGGVCLVEKFEARSKALEASRMLGGHRFFVQSAYNALPDPNEVDDPQSYWKVAGREAIFPQLDGDDPLAKDFNAFVLANAGQQMLDAVAAEPDEFNASSDSQSTVFVKDVAGANRISLQYNSFAYFHGAAHGEWGISYLHYLVPENREVVASDVFAGDAWEKTLTDFAWEQLQADHADWLQVDDSKDIANIVVDPSRWSFDNDYGLTIQFQPYEVAPYAYGAPTIIVPWEKLDDVAAKGRDQVRYGF
ncbi:DUF3298 domain-containing protein [Devosia sp. 2618]|uniref:DUF3298 domain-containing protein n=1 Tax=Devosia sp. 2618 TaxID=3156454 RepID=UPI003395E584